MSLASIIERVFGSRIVDPADGAASVMRVVEIDVIEHRTALICEGAAGPSTVIVPAVPTERSVDSWHRVMRIDRIDIIVAGAAVTASVSGTNHRLPSRRSLPLSVALALAQHGIACRVIEFDSGSGG